MSSEQFKRAQQAYQNEKHRERRRRAQWNKFILTTGQRYVVVNWITGGKRGIMLTIEEETDRIDIASATRKVAAASHPLATRDEDVVIYDRVKGKVLALQGGEPVTWRD